MCYIHVHDAKRSKLDDKAEVGVLLGYGTLTKGYKVYNVQSKKVMLSRYLQFDEDSYWDWEENLVVKEQVVSQQVSTSNLSSSSSSQNKEFDDEDPTINSPVLKRSLL